ncbi:hypothetical protein Csa_004735 [Cucumis sativus]|nr:hypothetical protein Csa_004735 [Cucumis sativus]
MNLEKQKSGGSHSTSWHECSICKKSFKSAKALGGHMRVHNTGEIDAKLKQSSLGPISTDLRWVVPSAIAEGSSRDRNRGKGKKVQELQLFSQKPSKLKKKQSDEKAGGQSSQHDNVDNELDLELRLGSNPKNFYD